MSFGMNRRRLLQNAAGLGLVYRMPGRRWALAGAVPPAEIRGHVVSGAKPLSGVRVSDGYRVVTTNSSGEFSIQVGPESGPFLMVTTPAGYWTNRFAIPLDTAVDRQPIFDLQRTENHTAYTAVYLTDVHLGEGHAERSYAGFAATLDEINSLDPLPALCWVGGDITLQGGKGERYIELMSRLRMPVRNAVGNHEMLVRETDPRGRFYQFFGPTYYSFDLGAVHYVTLDGCQVNHQAEGYKNVEGRLSPRELHWLAEDLRHVPEGMTSVVTVHIPLVSNYAERRGTTADRVPYWIMSNADEAVDLLAQHGVSLVLQGHLHENQRIGRKGIEFVESISVCGRWWKTAEGTREHGVSGEPRGYRVLEIDGAKVRHRYQSTAEARVAEIGEIVGPPSPLLHGQESVLAINIFDATADAVVSASLDETPFTRLPPGTGHSYHEGLQPAHHWQWKLPALSVGTHRIRVQVEEPGEEPKGFEHVVPLVLRP